MNTEKLTRSVLLGPLLFDFAACILLGLLFILVPELTIQPYNRGFFCNDETIRLPYKEDTISPGLLVLILIVITVGIIAAVEVYRDFRLRSVDSSYYLIRGIGVNRIIVRFCTYLGYCLFGICFEYVICEATKLAVGRLRPHFIDVCRPNIGWAFCNPPYLYITNYTCTSTFSKYLKKEAHVSFFSGHTATTMHVVTYCVIYLYIRLPRRIYGVTIVPTIQTILVTAGLLVGYSRISDHKHHWSDVFAGAIVGIITGSLSAVWLAQLTKRQKFLIHDQQPLLVDSDDSKPSQDEYKTRSNAVSESMRSNAIANSTPQIQPNADSQTEFLSATSTHYLPHHDIDRTFYPSAYNNPAFVSKHHVSDF